MVYCHRFVGTIRRIMTKTIAAPEIAEAPTVPTYVPLRAFIEQMAHTEEDNPYQSTFSFEPFIEKMKENKRHALNGTAGVDTSFLDEAVEQLSSLLDPASLDTPEKRHKIISILFPTLFFEGQVGFVGKPFSKDFFYMTPAMEEVFTSDV
ncbi:MAG: hypothetical protein AAF597_13065, partial [Bacteroidota bacterium]